MKRIGFLSLAAAFLLAAAGIACTKDHVDPPPPTTGTFKIINNTNFSVTALYFAPSTSSTWGSNYISTPIATGGGSFSISNVVPEKYKYRVRYSNGVEPDGREVIVQVGQISEVTLSGEVPTTGTFKIINNTNLTIIELYFTPSTSSNWGPNFIKTPIATGGGSFSITNVVPDMYDYRLRFSGGVYRSDYDISVQAGQTREITLSGDGSAIAAEPTEIHAAPIQSVEKLAVGTNKAAEGMVVPMISPTDGGGLKQRPTKAAEAVR